MASKKQTITKLTLACVVACLLTITPQTVLSQDVDQLFQQGNAAYKQGDFSEVESIFRQVIKIDPNNAVAYNNLGIALRQQGKLEEAIASYQKAIELDPNYADVYINLGLALSDQGKLDSAIANYQKALSLSNVEYVNYFVSSSHAIAYNNLGYALQQQGKLESAIQEYQRSLEIDPEYIAAKNNLREAERLLAINLNPPLPDIDDTQHLPSVEDEPLVNILRSTARIIAQVSAEGTSIGAGWVVKKEANTVWIVTNRHVVSDEKTKIPSKKIEVEFFSELPDTKRPRYDATIINSTERNDSLDLAVLKVTGIPDDIQALAMGSGRVQRNASTLIIGHPHTIIDSWSVSSGGVINFNPNNPIMAIDANVAQGNSGGPVIDSNNQVIGMMVSLRTNVDPAIDPNQATLNLDVNQPATGGVGLAYRIDVVVDQLREWGIIN